MKQIVMLMTLTFSVFAFAKSGGAKPLSCPVDPLRSEVRKVAVQEFKLNKKQKILVCVAPELVEDGKLKSKYLTKYDAYLFEGQKSGKRVLTGSNTPVQFEMKKGELLETMNLSLRGNYHPLFQEKIVCDKGLCKRKEKRCVFNQYHISPASPKDLEREKIIYAKGLAKVQEMTEGDLILMANLALSGRKMAFDFFTSMDEPILMGVTKPFYQNMQGLLKEIRSEGHLALQQDKDNKKGSSIRAAL